MIEGYTVREKLFRNERRAVYRGVRDSDQAPVIIKSLFVGIATEEDVAAVRQESDILSRPSVDGVPDPLGLCPMLTG